MLGDVQVLEVSGQVSAAFAGKLLAGFGAEVVKLERYPAGDPTRDPDGPDPALFLFLNTGKRAVTANLAHPDGRELLYRLLPCFDVLLVDTTGLAEEHGVEHSPELPVERLPEQFPRLVVVATSPFGATGPYHGFAGSEHTIFHAGGEGYLLGAGLLHEQFPDRPPVGAGGHLAGYQTGLTAATGALAALLDRDHTGRGQFVDVSAQDAQLSLNHLPVMRFFDGVLETTASRGFTFGGVMPCADGYVEVLPLEEHQWQDLVGLMGNPQWAADERFATGRDRARHGREVNQHLREWMRTRKRDQLAAIGQTSACPIAPYYDVDEAMATPHARERGSFQRIDHPRAGPGSYPRMPFRLGTGGEPIDERPAPGLGEHTTEIYGSYLGMSAAEIDGLRSRGAL